MLPLEIIIPFFMASVLLALAPGPDNIFVLTQSVRSGWLAGVVITTGLCSGLVFHTSLVAFGVAAIFQTSDLAFNLLRIFGSLYLLYLAWGAFKASANISTASEEKKNCMWGYFTKGVIMNITNPKVSIFFLAFLPQFVDPKNGGVTFQIMLLGSIFMGAAFSIFSTIAIFSGVVSEKINSSGRFNIYLNKVSAVIFVVLAIKLLWN